MASFDTHIKCDKCHDKGPRNDPCLLGRGDCLACLLLTPDEHQQLYEKGKWITSLDFNDVYFHTPDESVSDSIIRTKVSTFVVFPLAYP